MRNLRDIYFAVTTLGAVSALYLLVENYTPLFDGFIELTRYLPSPASRPDFGPAMRQILIGLMIILMLRFRPEGLFRERSGLDRGPVPAAPAVPASQRAAASRRAGDRE